MPVKPGTPEATAGGHLKWKAKLAYGVRPCVKEIRHDSKVVLLFPQEKEEDT